MFGAISSCRADTVPDKLVLPVAIEQYVAYQNAHGHQGLTVSSLGFLIGRSFLRASPDGAVYDPTDHQHPFGFLEVKCPNWAR